MRLLLMSLSWVSMACEISSMSILMLIAAGNHDFDFGTLEQSRIVLRLLKWPLGYPHLCTLIQDTKFVGNCRPIHWDVL